jgi:hypothetical protein
MLRIFNREKEITRLQTSLEATDFPRLKMFFLVSITGGVGFLSSFLMLRAGLTMMALRYPAAVGVAYLVFLFFLWIWIRFAAEDYESGRLTFVESTVSPTQEENKVSISSSNKELPSNSGESGIELVSDLIQSDWSAMPVLALIAVLALGLSSLWIVYTAPTLFAELLIDGVLSAKLYYRLRGMDTQNWLTTAVHRTVKPFVITAIVASLCGSIMHSLHPAANSLGEVIQDVGMSQ